MKRKIHCFKNGIVDLKNIKIDMKPVPVYKASHFGFHGFDGLDFQFIDRLLIEEHFKVQH